MNPDDEILHELQAQYSRLSPIIILAPTPRCGSTLLQRALNLGGQTIIYGENFLMAEFAPHYLAGDLDDIAVKARVSDKTMTDFLDGNRGMDASSLYPDYIAYRRKLLGYCFEIAELYRLESLKHGFAKWGFKHQLRDPRMFGNFTRIMSDFRAVTLYRDVVDVAKSTRARWPQNLQDARQAFAFGRRWRDNLQFLLGLTGDRNLVVRYEDMVGDRERWIPRIEAHVEAAVAPAAFERKVNVHNFSLESDRPMEGYVPPAALPEPMLRAVLHGAAPLRGQLGYPPVG